MKQPTTRDRIHRLINILRMETRLHFEISRYSPGDGWARYSLQVKSPDSSFEVVNSLNAKEMEKYLDGMYSAIRILSEQKGITPLSPKTEKALDQLGWGDLRRSCK